MLHHYILFLCLTLASCGTVPKNIDVGTNFTVEHGMNLGSFQHLLILRESGEKVGYLIWIEGEQGAYAYVAPHCQGKWIGKGSPHYVFKSMEGIAVRNCKALRQQKRV